jgi:outer membrane protein TolC
MKAKFAKGVVVLITGIIFLGSAFSVAYAEEEKAVLTINEALEKVWQNNLDLQKASLTLNNARISYEKARANVLQSESKIDQKQAELNWQQAQNTFQKSKDEAGTEVISSYNNFKYLLALVPLRQEKVKLAQNNLDRVKEKVKAGTAGELEELAAEISLETARQQLENTKQQLDIARESLSLATGIANIVEFNLVSEFDKGVIEDSLDVYIAAALQKREEIKFARKNIEIAGDQLEQLKIIDSPWLDINKANNDLKLLQITLKLLEESIKSEVRQRYQQLESLSSQLGLLNLGLGQAKKNLDNADKQFQAGLITKDELSSKKVDFKEVYLELQKSKGSGYVAYLNLQVSAGERLDLGGKNED